MVARIDDGTMSWTLTHSALVQAGVENSTPYQRSEKPGGGNCRKGAELNEMITTTASGASRKTATMITSVPRSRRQGVMPSALTARSPSGPR